MINHIQQKSTRLSPTESTSSQQIEFDVDKDYRSLDQFRGITVNSWLEQNALGFSELQDDERLAIFHFSLLWSLFEAKALNRRGNARKILEVVKRWAGNGLLKMEIFEPQFNYFRRRYYVHGQFTYYYEDLRLQQGFSRNFVKEALSDVNAKPDKVAAAVLIIAYRIRNNLFHGEKWSYELRGQLENFNHANVALMNAIDLHRKVTK